MPEPNPTTFTGVEEALLVLLVPSPNSPQALKPQHLTAPPVVRAHEWLSAPAETEATPEPNPTTSTGVVELVVELVEVPFPRPPALLFPQHLAAPLVVRAQVTSYPAVTVATPEPKPRTSTGVSELVVVPFPN